MGKAALVVRALQCNSGCDPTKMFPATALRRANNLLGSITHNQGIQAGPPDGFDLASGLTWKRHSLMKVVVTSTTYLIFRPSAARWSAMALAAEFATVLLNRFVS